MAKKDEFTPENFATLCSVVSFDDTDNIGSTIDFTIKLPVLMHENLSRVEQWLDSDQLYDVQDFVYVATAYLQLYDSGEIPESLLARLESYIKTNALSIDANQAIILA